MPLTQNLPPLGVESVNPPLVTVGVPTYNNLKGLKNVFNCITHQSYKNLEILVSVNPTKDTSVNNAVINMIQHYQGTDTRIRAVFQPYDIGVDGNFRFLADHAMGKYFMYAQDDDWWHGLFIKTLVASLEENPGASVAMCPAKYITADGKQSKLHALNGLSVFNAVGNGDIGLIVMGIWKKEKYLQYEIRLDVHILGGDHIMVTHMLLAGEKISITQDWMYLKGYTPGRFNVCFRNDYFYSFRSWYHLIKTLIVSPYIPFPHKMLIPFIAITNFGRSCAITIVQAIITLPEGNPVRTYIQHRFFGAN